MKKIGFVILVGLAFCPRRTSAASTWALQHYVGSYLEGTSDGGFIFLGQLFSFHTSIFKIASDGDTLWSNELEEFGTEGWNHQMVCVQKTSDGNYIGTGLIDNPETSRDLLLLKFNQSGHIIWKRTYGWESMEWGNCVQQISDGGYIIVGCTESGSDEGWGNLWLLKTDSQGDTLWTRIYGETDYDIGNWIEETKDGGYIVTGETNTNVADPRNLWLLKFDLHGDTSWTRVYGGSHREEGNCVLQTMDNCYIISGHVYMNDRWRFWVLKTNSIGDTLWTRVYFESAQGNSCIIENGDGSYVVSAFNADNPGAYNRTLMKLYPNGDTIWTSPNGGHSIGHTLDGGYIVGGSPIFKTDSCGNIGDVGPTGIDEIPDIEYGKSYPIAATVKNFGKTTESTPVECIITFRSPEVEWDTVYGDTVNVKGMLPLSQVKVSFKEYDFPQKGAYFFYVKTLRKNDLNPDNDSIMTHMGEGICEPLIPITQHYEIASPIGSAITLRYSDCPQGFHATIFDAGGRRVDEIKSQEESGTITWGECYGPGVYFIRESSGKTPLTYKVILVK